MLRSYRGYRLFAVDGSDLHIPTNPHDPETFYPNSNGKKPYNLLHLNVLYNLLTHTYQDAILQKSVSNENSAVVEMLLVRLLQMFCSSEIATLNLIT